jgi:hypothetical protein
MKGFKFKGKKRVSVFSQSIRVNSFLGLLSSECFSERKCKIILVT